MRTFAPPNGQVQQIEMLWQDKPSSQSYEIYPDACCDLIFSITESSAKAILYGSWKDPGVHFRDMGHEYWSIRFEPGWTPQLLDYSAKELVGEQIEVERVGKLSVQDIGETLFRARGTNEKLRVLGAVSAQIPYLTRDPILDLVAEVKRRGGVHSVRELSEWSGYSERQLERKIMSVVGFTPKSYTRIMRFQHALKVLLRRKRHGECGKISWADFAVEVGYYDQSHLINEFRRLSGRLPSELAF